MSDYCHRKAVRLRISEDEAFKIFKVSDRWDIMDCLEKTKFEVAPTYEFFIDYNLPCDDYGEGSWGKTRALSWNEFGKYVDIFRTILPHDYTIKYENLRLVEYCWYDATEAPDYFDETTCHDDFYDEV